MAATSPSIFLASLLGVATASAELWPGYTPKPLDPIANPYYGEFINRDRVYDFYAKEALYYLTAPEKPEILPQFPGLDGGTYGHWGNQNDAETWKDGRVSLMDFGSVASGVFRGAGRTMPRGVSVRVSETLSACFNPDTLNFEVMWKGPFIKWSDTRRGLMNGTPMGGEPVVIQPPGPAWRDAGDTRYHGYYRSGQKVIFSYKLGEAEVLDCALPGTNEQPGRILEFKGAVPATKLALAPAPFPMKLHVEPADAGVKLVEADGVTFLDLTASPNVKRVILGEVAPVDLAALTKGGPANWAQTLETKGTLGEGAPYAIDTLTLPYENPWKSLMYLGGHDFLPDGRVVFCTFFGDVWIGSGVDAKLEKLTWKRFAAGLHQALGLKVLKGQIYVQGRDQITRLHDLNGDNEADFYECFSSAYEASPGGHDFTTGLESDDQGRFYVASGKQGLVRISADGLTSEVLATGFRNPDGLGVNKDGSIVMTSVQEGNWTPASAVCEIVKGGHFGQGGPRPGPLGYVPPLIYFPRGVDNSCGGQTWIDSDRWGPVKDGWVHFSSGTCSAFLLSREVIAGQAQAAAIPLKGEFLSGAHRGRFSPFDGQLYVASAEGWGQYGVKDGGLQRVRFTGGDYPHPIRHESRDNGILLHFAQPVEAGEAKQWFAQQWNYLYGPAYGSPEYSVNFPEKPGHDRVEIKSVQVLDGGRSIFVEMPQIQPVHTLHLYRAGAKPLEMFATIHRLGEPFTDFPGYEKIPKTPPHATGFAALGTPDPNPWEKGDPGRAITLRAALGLQFETKRLTAKAGERISLTFENPDTVPHNFVLVAAGTLNSVGDKANRMMTDPKGFVKHYVPSTDEVLAYSSMIMPAGSQTIHFNAPAKPGEYPYMCTFPGHWMVMNGILKVE